ncbi:MAG: TonB-dependent receptor, partial [Proteobacteria bacterium]|nr:TonB-dependent receptor [Pseudomonadota bacterium]
PAYDPNVAAAFPKYQNYSPFPFALGPETNYVIFRRPLEGGPRIFRQTVNTLVASTGLSGDLPMGERDFHWDAGLLYGINRADQIHDNAFDAERIRQALSYNQCAADPKCVPLDIFGGQGSDGQGTITREMLDYIQFIQKDVSQQALIDATANISGGLFDLPGGMVGVAAGLEWRRQQGFFQPDGIVARGDTAGIPAAPTQGGFDVAEGYAEVRIPILDQMSVFDLWDLSGAARFSSYATSGNQTTLKFGSRMRVASDLLLRGTWGQGFRAPGIGELFGSPARFFQTLNDGCSGLNQNTTDPQVRARCNQLWGGVLPPDGSYTQANSQLPVTTGGNPQLRPETSTSLTATLAYSPKWVGDSGLADHLSLELTYYRYRIDNAIQAINGQVTLDRCILGHDPIACARIQRVPGGAIQRIDGQLTNFGSVTTDGIDFSLSYRSPDTAAGRFRLTSLSSFLMSFTDVIPAGTETGTATIKRAGTEVGSPTRAFPKLKSTLIGEWSYGNQLRASWTLRYIHSVQESCRGLPKKDMIPGEGVTFFEKFCSNPTQETRRIPAAMYHNVQVTWTPEQFKQELELTVGVNNLFGSAAPVCYSCDRGFDATTYEIPGVFGYVRAGYRL